VVEWHSPQLTLTLTTNTSMQTQFMHRKHPAHLKATNQLATH
jgi:hypothetical protein